MRLRKPTQLTYKVEFIPSLIIADFIAKVNLLIMRQYHGSYGCSMCFIPGLHVRGAHVYPHSERFQMRTPSEHMKLIQKVEQGKIQRDAKRSKKRYQCVKGVLGGGTIYELLPNLLLTAPIDIMHQLYLGVADELLSFSFKSFEIQDEFTIDKAAGDLKITCEFKRNLQPLRCLADLKPNDLKTYLLYLAPIIFRPFFHHKLRHWFGRSEPISPGA